MGLRGLFGGAKGAAKNAEEFEQPAEPTSAAEREQGSVPPVVTGPPMMVTVTAPPVGAPSTEEASPQVQEQSLAPASAPIELPPPLTYGNPSLGSDPAGLPDPDVAVPDTVLDGAKLDGLTIRGGSLRGDDHRYYGHTRQDSMSIWAFPGTEPNTTDAILVCVADGVGSEPYSHVGSARACELVREDMRPYYKQLLHPQGDDEPVRSLCNQLVGGLRRQLINIAVRSKWEPKSLSTTLVGALIEGDPAEPARRRCVVFAVGDSPAFLLRNGTFQPCFQDPHDELISSTGTDALPNGFTKVETAVLSIGTDDMLLLCSDGLSNPMRTKEVERDLAALWSRGEIPGLPEFCWQLSFRAKTYGDDRTAICVWGR